jgi:hypothetical protein
LSTQEKSAQLFNPQPSVESTVHRQLTFQTKLRQDNRDKILKQKRTKALFS